MYYHINMDNTFIGDNMELIEVINAIEETKANYELAKSEEEAQYYKTIIQELRTEKKEIFNRRY